MKSIKLIFSRLWFYISSNVFIFCMFAIGCIVCSISFLFFYGNGMQTKRFAGDGGNTVGFRTYKLEFSKPVDYDKIINNEIFNSDLIDDVKLVHSLNAEELPKELKDIPSNFLSVCTYLEGKYEIKSSQGRTKFTDEEIKNGENVLIVPGRDEMYNMQIGNEIILSNNKYEIIGIAVPPDEFYMTTKSFASMKYSIKSISIILNTQLSSVENGKYELKLHDEFPSASLTDSPSELYNMAQSNALGDFSFVAVIFVVSSLAFMFLMKFMMDKSSSENVIYSIVGATKVRIVILLLIENVILSFVFAVIASIIHSSLYEVLFKKLNIVSDVEYYFSDYLFIIIMTVLLSCLVALPFIISTAKNSIIKNKNKYNE